MSPSQIIAWSVLIGLVLGFSLACVARRPAPRSLPYRVRTRTGRELTPVQIRAALTVGEDNALWMAVHQLIEVQIEAAVTEALDPDIQHHPHLLNFHNGAAANLGRLQAFLLDEREAGLKNADDTD